MPNAIIYVFTGTYNTLKTAEMIKTHFEASHIPAQISEVKVPLDLVPTSDSYDYVGFGYPVHAFNTPQIFLRFVRSLPIVQQQKAFIFKTSGEPFRFNDASSYKLARILKKKGYILVQEIHLLMPYNIMFRYADSLVKQMALYSDAMCRQLVLKLLRNDVSVPRYRLRHRLVSAVFRIQWLGAWLNGLIYHVNMKKCTQCMRCVSDCPAGNISFASGRFHFSHHCSMCMRCTMNCPANAVNIGILTLWRVNGAYDFKRVLDDPGISSDYVNEQTKGYFRLFRKYYRNADASLAADGINIHGCMTPKARVEPPEFKVFEEFETMEESENDKEPLEDRGVIIP